MPILARAGSTLAVISCGEFYSPHCVKLLPEQEELNPLPLVIDEHDPVLAIALLSGGLPEQKSID